MLNKPFSLPVAQPLQCDMQAPTRPASFSAMLINQFAMADQVAALIEHQVSRQDMLAVLHYQFINDATYYWPTLCMQGIIGEGYERLVSGAAEDEADDFEFHGDEAEYEMGGYFATGHKHCVFGAMTASSLGSHKRRLVERVHVAFPLAFSGSGLHKPAVPRLRRALIETTAAAGRRPRREEELLAQDAVPLVRLPAIKSLAAAQRWLRGLVALFSAIPPRAPYVALFWVAQCSHPKTFFFYAQFCFDTRVSCASSLQGLLVALWGTAKKGEHTVSTAAGLVLLAVCSQAVAVHYSIGTLC